MEPEKSITLLVEDVRRQKEIAQEALNEAKQIDDLIKHLGDNVELKAKLEQRKAGVLKIARELVANAATTSSSLAATLDTIAQFARS
jgi:predicted transcriptional regulator